MKDETINGLTAEEWVNRLFATEYCAECGGDKEDHIVVAFLGCWFAKCKYSERQNAKAKRGRYSPSNK